LRGGQSVFKIGPWNGFYGEALMKDRNDLLSQLRTHGTQLHAEGITGRARLIGRTIEVLLKDEHPALRRAVASELKLTSNNLTNPLTRALILDALNELEKPATSPLKRACR
jgi:hypothetical protein